MTIHTNTVTLSHKHQSWHTVTSPWHSTQPFHHDNPYSHFITQTSILARSHFTINQAGTRLLHQETLPKHKVTSSQQSTQAHNHFITAILNKGGHKAVTSLLLWNRIPRIHSNPSSVCTGGLLSVGDALSVWLRNLADTVISRGHSGWWPAYVHQNRYYWTPLKWLSHMQCLLRWQPTNDLTSPPLDFGQQGQWSGMGLGRGQRLGCQDKQGSEVEWDLDEARGRAVRTSRAVKWNGTWMRPEAGLSGQAGQWSGMGLGWGQRLGCQDKQGSSALEVSTDDGTAKQIKRTKEIIREIT